jgi:hypothetical protein
LTDARACGADDVAGPLYTGERLRKLRFLMTDNRKYTKEKMVDRAEPFGISRLVAGWAEQE